MRHILALDPGYGAIKLYSDKASLVFPSSVSLPVGVGGIHGVAGLSDEKRAMLIHTDHGDFFVGERSSAWGRPLENMDYERLTGSPELRAAVYGALSNFHLPDEPMKTIVGLPILALEGEVKAVNTNIQGVRNWLEGEHKWTADGVSHALTISTARITSQTAGALFDFLLDDDGNMAPETRKLWKREIAVINVGMNTIDMLVARAGKIERRFTAGGESGVRRLLDLSNRQRLYSLGELDEMLRGGELDIARTKPVWAREVTGAIKAAWGDSMRRFACVIAVGGGAVLLKESLSAAVGPLLVFPDDPVIATARGLFKFALSQSHDRGHS